MEVMDYHAFRDALIDALASYDLQTTVDEAVFLGSMSRGCEVFAFRSDEPKEVWGKLGFEWVPANQILLENLKDSPEGAIQEALETDPGVEVMIHASFHLHFGLLPVAPDVMRTVALDISSVGQTFFGDDGGVIAEVSMTSSDAHLECLRYEVNTSAPIIATEPWWDQLAEVYASMLDKLQEIFERLNYEYGSPRDSFD